MAAAFNPEDNLHWLAWNIPATAPVVQIEEGKLPEGAVNGRNGRTYTGMGAPNGPRYHHYVFEFYALNAKLDLPVTGGRAELFEAMKDKVVAKAAYVGRFRNDTNATRPAGPGGAGGALNARSPIPRTLGLTRYRLETLGISSAAGMVTMVMLRDTECCAFTGRIDHHIESQGRTPAGVGDNRYQQVGLGLAGRHVFGARFHRYESCPGLAVPGSVDQVKLMPVR